MKHRRQQHIVSVDQGQPVVPARGAPLFGQVVRPVPVPEDADQVELVAPGEDGSEELVSPRVQALFLVLAAVSVPLVALGRMAGVL
jgi:hypothetical protein